MVTHPRLGQVQVTGGAAGDTPESFLHQFAGAGSFGFALVAPHAPSYVPSQVGQVPPYVSSILGPLENPGVRASYDDSLRQGGRSQPGVAHQPGVVQHQGGWSQLQAGYVTQSNVYDASPVLNTGSAHRWISEPSNIYLQGYQRSVADLNAQAYMVTTLSSQVRRSECAASIHGHHAFVAGPNVQEYVQPDVHQTHVAGCRFRHPDVQPTPRISRMSYGLKCSVSGSDLGISTAHQFYIQDSRSRPARTLFRCFVQVAQAPHYPY